MSTIKIDRLDIRIRGCPKQIAHEVINGFGRKLQDRLLKTDFSAAGVGGICLSAIETEPVRVDNRTDRREIQDAVISRVIDAIAPSVRETGRMRGL
jgi:hypothetical protein